MSRTDKDRPHWVREEDPTELRYEHHLCGAWRGQFYECDLEGTSKYRFTSDGRRYRRCDYGLVNRPWDSPPKDFVDHVWNSLERRRVRDELGEIRKLVNAGDDDVDFANWQHRHGAQWLWW